MESASPSTYATAHVDRMAELLRDGERPARVGSYRIIELLGQGGMGEVYKAEQQAPVQRIVALKLIKLGMDSREVIRRFETERQTLALMSHPNVARMFDGGLSETGRPYFAMEYVPGRAITTYCDEESLNLRQRLELFIQACEAVQHAHQKTIIHRDLKPGNILVTRENPSAPPLVKVIDFGVAKATGPEIRAGMTATQQGQLLGTPEYMSPEQADLARGAGDVDTRSDIYSLGVVLYELLIGARPFDNEMEQSDENRNLIRNLDPPRPSTRLSRLDGTVAAEVARRRQLRLDALHRELRHELEWIPLKALRKDRAERYRTAAELADDIRNHLAHRPLIAGPESRVYRMRKFLRRNRGAVAAGAAVVVALTIGLVAAGAMYLRSERLRVLAVQNSDRADREAATARLEAAKQDAINHFLNSMLGQLNPRNLSIPGRGNVRDLRMLDVLAASVQRLDAGSLADQPVIEAAVRSTIGFAYLNLGEFDAAEANMWRAIELNQKAYGPEHVEVARSLNQLASVLRMRGKVAQAEPLHRQVLAMRIKLLGERHLDVAQSYNELGAVYLDQGKFDEAIEILTRAVELTRELDPSNPSALITDFRNLANALAVRGRFDEASALLHEALSNARKAYGDEHYEVAQVMFQLAILDHRRGDLPQAEAQLRECLAMQKKLLGEVHPAVARSLQFLGALLCTEKKYDEALPMLQAALEMHRKFLGAEHMSIASTLNHIGLVRMGQGDFAAAEPLLLEAVKINGRVVGERHAETLRCVRDLVKLYDTWGKPEQAAAWRAKLPATREAR